MIAFVDIRTAVATLEYVNLKSIANNGNGPSSANKSVAIVDKINLMKQVSRSFDAQVPTDVNCCTYLANQS